ncbi:MAG: 50S ribosomal protein L17 [Bacteroidetes bacterium]|nr:50S ribosomal protein L17 [Bacteroidota bacterium]MBX7046393.1 50S ribosomal protein L17 [Ignavibacteria bacterium]
MKHGVKGRKLGRTASHRRATLANLSCSLIKHKRIITTVARAKELRTVIEPLVTKAKRALQYNDANQEKGIHLRRIAKSFLRNQEAVQILFNEIGPKVAERNGGYTRVLKMGHRPGDGGETALIEFVDFDIVSIQKEHQAAKDAKKGGSKDSGKETAPATEPVKEEKKAKTPKAKKPAAPKTEKKAPKEKKAAGSKVQSKQKV